MGRRYGTVSPPRVRNLFSVPADAVLVHVPNDMFWGKGCPYSPSCREGMFSETGLPTISILGNPYLYARISVRCRGVCRPLCSASFLEEFFSETQPLR